QSTATMTLEAFMTAYAFEPTFRFRLCTASRVMIETTVRPGASSNVTSALTAPGSMARTTPGRALRALSFMMTPAGLERLRHSTSTDRPPAVRRANRLSHDDVKVAWHGDPLIVSVYSR